MDDHARMLADTLQEALSRYERAKLAATAALAERRRHDEALDARALYFRVEARRELAMGKDKPNVDTARDLIAQAVEKLTEPYIANANAARDRYENADAELSIARENLRAVHALIALHTGARPADR